MESRTFKPQIESITKIQEFVKSMLPPELLDEKKSFAIDLIIEELIINTINYGIKDVNTGIIDVSAGVLNDTLSIKISDNGIEFNPLEKKDPDIFTGIDDRQPGGLGIFLVKKFVKKIQYERAVNRNNIQLWLA